MMKKPGSTLLRFLVEILIGFSACFSTHLANWACRRLCEAADLLCLRSALALAAAFQWGLPSEDFHQSVIARHLAIQMFRAPRARVILSSAVRSPTSVRQVQVAPPGTRIVFPPEYCFDKVGRDDTQTSSEFVHRR